MPRAGVGAVAAFAAGALLTACGEPPVPGELPAVPSYSPTATIEEIMRHMIDPAADAIWESVVTEVTEDGVVEHVPGSDEDWEALRGHALTLIESTNLLLMPGRPVAAPGSRSEMPGIDLEPEQIEALLARDRTAWTQFVAGLRSSGATVLDAVGRHDVDALLIAGDGLDLACENCHLRYWYPSLADTDTARAR
jgi:hypothetical protein